MSKPRLAAPDRKRNGHYAPLQIDGKYCCLDCRAPVDHLGFDGKKRRPPLRCIGCLRKRMFAMEAIRTRAASAVAKAIRMGELERATSFLCVDCNRPAREYDHRDYTKPLAVVPVCRSCNVMRGPADVWTSDPAKVAA